MVNILFIVPYPELTQVVQSAIQSHPESSRLHTNIVVATADKFEDMGINQYDVVIARGYTAIKALERSSRVPTIELNISSFDVIRALKEAKSIFNPEKVAFCGNYNALGGAAELGDVFEMEVKVYAPENYNHLDRVIRQAKKEHCEVIIGGYSARMIAVKEGLNSIIIRTGEEAVTSALYEAIRAVEILKQEKIRSEMHSTITKSAKEGILYVNDSGIIQISNQPACEMAGRKSVIQRNISEVFPFLSKSFEISLKSNKYISSELHILQNGKQVNAIFSPVSVKDEVSGVVINLNDITRIQELEGQIRRKLSERGLRAKYHFDDLIHESKVMKDVIIKSKRYASTESNVIIVGETGTGKELFAQSIHNDSKRKNGPFVAVNCAALPESLLESELFGYVEGAFTGTSKGGKIGLFEQAHKGTIFLDEISEIPISLQSKLLRVLQEKEIRRIGDEKVTSIDVRVLSATNKSLKAMVKKGEFRNDLLYRLDVLRIFLPPLKKREKDIENLFEYIVEKVAMQYGLQQPLISEDARLLLYEYDFPGNIRELTNIAERVCVLGNEKIDRNLMLEALFPLDIEMDDEDTYDVKNMERKKFSSELDELEWALDKCKGNQTQAAKVLEIDRSTLWRKLKKYGLK